MRRNKTINHSHSGFKLPPINGALTVRKVTISNPNLPHLKSVPSEQLNVKPSPQIAKMKRLSTLSALSLDSNPSIEDEHEIWDNNSDLRVKKMTLEDSKDSNKGVGQFLQLYKARFGGFPGNREKIKNEQVIQVAVGYAAQNKKLFKKYFPSKQVVFEDDNDYSQPYDVNEDNHFQQFQQFHDQKKKKTIIIKTKRN